MKHTPVQWFAHQLGIKSGSLFEKALEIEKEHKKPKFTDVEISHIVSVLMENEREGWYYGNKEQYWKRHQRILDKLLKQRQ